MHIYFSGIGGTGIGPLALIAKQAGFEVTGSDEKRSQYTDYLESKDLDITFEQTGKGISDAHKAKQIDWYVYSSALTMENPHHPEKIMAENMKIKTSKRDEFLNYLIQKKNLDLIAFSGTHGKTTSTAMAIWVAKKTKI